MSPLPLEWKYGTAVSPLPLEWKPEPSGRWRSHCGAGRGRHVRRSQKTPTAACVERGGHAVAAGASTCTQGVTPSTVLARAVNSAARNRNVRRPERTVRSQGGLSHVQSVEAQGSHSRHSREQPGRCPGRRRGRHAGAAGRRSCASCSRRRTPTTTAWGRSTTSSWTQRWRRRPGYKDARDDFSEQLADLSQSALSRYGAVAAEFSEPVARRFGVTCLYLLLRATRRRRAWT